MRLFVSFTILLFCSFQGFSQKTSPVKKTIGSKRTIILKPGKTIKPIDSQQLFGPYIIFKYYSLVKKSAKKKEVNSLLNSVIKVNKESISGVSINDIIFSIYEVEQMKKDDYLYRVFNQSIITEIAELPSTLRVHKTDLSIFFGIIQLPNGNVAFPYKGGLIIAKPTQSK